MSAPSRGLQVLSWRWSLFRFFSYWVMRWLIVFSWSVRRPSLLSSSYWWTWGFGRFTQCLSLDFLAFMWDFYVSWIFGDYSMMSVGNTMTNNHKRVSIERRIDELRKEGSLHSETYKHCSWFETFRLIPIHNSWRVCLRYLYAKKKNTLVLRGVTWNLQKKRFKYEVSLRSSSDSTNESTLTE